MIEIISCALRRLDELAQRTILIPVLVTMASVAAAGIWLIDREPSVEVLEAIGETPTGAPGEEILILSKVVRNPRRRCDIELNRSFVDAHGFRFPMGGFSLTPDDVTVAERITPGTYRTTAMIPKQAAKGRGILVTTATFRCNPTHHLFPVRRLIERAVIVR